METFTELRHSFIYMLTILLWLTTTAKFSYAVENCTQWDKWVNRHVPSQTDNGDSEPIAEVKKNSALCGAHPTKIECLTAGGATADDMGQIVTCDLWHGLECDNMNQFDPSGCLDYKVRLACLKRIPECVCEIPMGLSNKFIVTDSQLTASSKFNEFSGAERGRIYMEKDGSFTGGWVPSVSNKKQWIQVDLLAPYEITGVMTQGQAEKPHWVTKYEVYYSTDGEHFFPVPKSPLDKTPMVFTGNKDQFTPVQHLFPKITGRFIRIDPLEWNTMIGLRFNILGCKSPSPKPHLKATTTMVTSTQTPGPLSCMYWTSWVSTSTPDKVGEYETIFGMNQLVHSCKKVDMKAIECRDMASKKSHDQTGEVGLSCDLQTVEGLLCKNTVQPDSKCNDYEIRVFCDECHYSSTVAPSPGQTDIPTSGWTSEELASPTAAPRPCENRTFWSSWINNHKPDDMGESEFMSQPEMNKFCQFGKINKIECTTLDGVDYTADMNMVTCGLTEGFNCDASLNAGFPCSDYRVRYQCEQVCLGSCEVGWSPWVNENHPDTYTPGDKEKTATEYQTANHFCVGGLITKTECWDVDLDQPHYSSGVVMQCSPQTGVTCSNADNFPVPCEDFKIRYYCAQCELPDIYSRPTTVQVTRETDKSTLSTLIETSLSTEQVNKTSSVETWEIILLTLAALIMFGLFCCVMFYVYMKYIKRNGKRQIEDFDGNSKTPEDCT